MKNVIKFFTDIRLWYLLFGLLVSIIAHEAFHVMAHFGQIKEIQLFPNFYTIVEMHLSAPGSLPIYVEEGIAYTITVLILFITVIDVFEISDSRDKRTLNETLFPKRK